MASSRERTQLRLTLDVPYPMAARLAAAMTGNDDDVFLAAEKAIREVLEPVGSEDEVELGVEAEREVVAGLREIARTQPWPRPEDSPALAAGECLVCGGGSCEVDRCLRRVVIVESRSGAYEQVEHLTTSPIILTADGIELTVERLVRDYAQAYEPDVVVVADPRGWKHAPKWLEDEARGLHGARS